MLEGYDITLRRALRLIGLSSSMYYYKPKRDDSEALKLMSDYAEENPTHGQDMMVKVFHKSHGWNHKKTVRLYHKLRLPQQRRRSGAPKSLLPDQQYQWKSLLLNVTN